MTPIFSQKNCQLLGIALFAFALIGRYSLLTVEIPPALGNTIWEAGCNLSSYLTIWTNSLVGVYFFTLAFFKNSKLGVFFQKPRVEKAILMYILFVGIAYHVLLSAIYSPIGMAKIYNLFLHYINPIYFLLYTLLFTKTGFVRYSDSLYWLLYPLSYGIYTLVRGELTGFYPYPFVAVNALGYAPVIKNIAGITISFFILGNIVIFVDGLIAKCKKTGYFRTISILITTTQLLIFSSNIPCLG